MPNQLPIRAYVYALFALAAAALCNTATAATACVWRVVNAPAPFYLVGTIHALSGHDYPLPKPYYQALKDSKRLLFEVDPHPKSNFGHDFVRALYTRKATAFSGMFIPTLGNIWQRISRPLAGRANRIGVSETCFLTVSSKCARGRSPDMWGIHGYDDVFS